jgi:bacterioferritin
MFFNGIFVAFSSGFKEIIMKDSHSAPPLINVKEIREQAMKSIDDGPITEDYPLDIKQACKLLNDALATEIVCVLRYKQHQIAAKGIDFPQVAAEFKEHAEVEEQHMMMLAERISQLGGESDMNPATLIERSAAEYTAGGDLMSMIQTNLIAERVVIEVYRKMIPWFGEADPTTRRMLEKILEDEEEHANDLADLMSTRSVQ